MYRNSPERRARADEYTAELINFLATTATAIHLQSHWSTLAGNPQGVEDSIANQANANLEAAVAYIDSARAEGIVLHVSNPETPPARVTGIGFSPVVHLYSVTAVDADQRPLLLVLDGNSTLSMRPN